jgi:signal transduction histidine kinase
MIQLPDQETFDALHPFAFATRGDGTVILVGRALRKMLPAMAEGRDYRELLEADPIPGISAVTPAMVVNQGIVLHSPLLPALRLRGPVFETHGECVAYLFATDLAVRSASDLISLGLRLDDLRLGEPIMDYLMLSQRQAIASTRLEESNARLLFENRLSRALLTLHDRTREYPPDSSFYSTCLEILSAGLRSSVGLYFSVQPSIPTETITLAHSFTSDIDTFASFIRASTITDYMRGSTLLGSTVRSGETVWCSDVRDLTIFARRGELPPEGIFSLIHIPIVVHQRTLGVFEFLKEGSPIDPAPERALLNLLRVSLENMISAKLAEQREREHIAMAIHSSKMTTLGEITAGVAHEINNPLHTLTMTCALVQRLLASENPDLPTAREHIEVAKRAIHRMAAIVQELKGFSRQSAHDEPQDTPIATIIRESLDLCHARFASQGIEMRVGAVPDGWLVSCKPSQITQVMLNLLNNASDAIAPLSTRWIAIDVEEQQSCYLISVTDSGSGIPGHISDKIMNPFFTTKPPEKGTGLGLSITSTILREHGGALTVDRECANTRFVITLPKRSPKGPPVEPLSEVE